MQSADMCIWGKLTVKMKRVFIDKVGNTLKKEKKMNTAFGLMFDMSGFGN